MRYSYIQAAFLSFGLAIAAWAAERYTGPIPPKVDIPYLVHADNLLETEVGEAKEETRKDNVTATLAGESSRARTPLAEPIFLIKTDKLQAERIAAYRMEIRDGSRQVMVSNRRSRNQRPIFLNVTRLDDRLYRIEVDEPLDNGEYTLSPEGSNQTFSFQVY